MNKSSQSSSIADSDTTALYDRVVVILEDVRRHVARTVNNAMVVAYWLIGREIVQELQGGAGKAGYGKQIITDLSRQLTERYGKGFSVPNVRNFRQFYLVYKQRTPEIRYPVGSGFGHGPEKRYPAGSPIVAPSRVCYVGSRSRIPMRRCGHPCGIAGQPR